nr:AraC family transcriptional regulator [uncultured Sphaerochaeta sp.]
MILTRDSVRLTPDFPFRAYDVTLRKEDNREDSYHWHDFCEITFINEGGGFYFVNGRQYPVDAGDLIIFNNTEPHGWQVSSQTLRLTVVVFALNFIPHIHDDYLNPFISRGSNFQNKIGRDEAYAANIIASIKEIHGEYARKKQGFRLMITGNMLRLLTFLTRHYEKDEGDTMENVTFVDKKKSMRRIEEALNYIRLHYSDKITLKEVAGEACMSESYFSTYFKKITNMNFMDYVTDLRIQKARELINTTDLTRTEIALQCGFNNMSNFYKMLKKHTAEPSAEVR